MKQKHGWVAALLVACVCSLVACGKPASPASSGKCWKIDAIRFNDGSSFYTRHVDAVRQALGKAGYSEGKDFVIRERSAQNELSNVPQLIDAALTDQTDLILTFQSPVLYTAIQKAPKVNKAFAILSDPFALGAGQSDTDHLPNVVGCYAPSPVKAMLEVARECNPKLKRLGTLFMIGDAESEKLKDSLAAVAKAQGVTLVAQGYSTQGEIVEAIRALTIKKVDALMPITDGRVRVVYPLLSKAAVEQKIPLLTFWPAEGVKASLICRNDAVKNGAADAFGQMVVRVLEGEDARKIPFFNAMGTEPYLTVDLTTARECGLVVPEAVVKRAMKVIQ